MSAPTSPRATRREWIGLAVIALPCMLYSMDLTVLNLAVPSLTADLRPSASQLLWIVDIYGFLIAGALLTMGTLGDRIGRRRLLLIGAACFGVASILAAFAPTAELLIVARALLGLAGATLAPSTLSLISNMFRDDRERTLAISIWVASFSAGGAIGPVIGGIMLQYFWWGSVFLIAVPIMILLLALGPILLPEYKSDTAGRLDLVSVAMSVVAVLAVIYGIKQLAEGGSLLWAIGSILLGLAVGTLFIRRQLGLEEPLLDLKLFRLPAFSAALAINLFGFFAAFGSFLLVAQYLQLVVGLSPLEAGLWGLPSGIGFVAGSLLTAPLLRLLRPAHLLALGLSLAAAGFLVMVLAMTSGQFWLFIVGVTMQAIGFSPCAAIAADLVVGAAPPDRAGTASGLNETSSEFGGALGIALMGALVTVLYRAYLAGTLPPDIPQEAAALVQHGIGAADAEARSMGGPAGGALLAAAQNAYVVAMTGTAFVAAALLTVAALMTLMVFRRTARSPDQALAQES